MNGPLPPGRSGLPVVGETIQFTRSLFQFVQRRVAKYGPVFRSHLVFRDAVVIAGPDACDVFMDSKKVVRKGGWPPHVMSLFGGPNLSSLDGRVHRDRKTIILKALDREALTAYLPSMERKLGQELEDWADRGEFGWLAEMKRVSMEMICENIFSLSPGPGTDGLARDYEISSRGFVGLIPRSLPGTALRRGIRARDRQLSLLGREVRRHIDDPTLDDGLSRMLAHRMDDRTRLGPEDAVFELQHVMLAGYVLFGVLAKAVVELALNPQVRARLAGEVESAAGAGPLTLDRIEAMPYLNQVVMEVKRTTPILPVVFGWTVSEFEFQGYSIPKDRMIIWPPYASNQLDQFTDAEWFDPDRFSPERAEDKRHPHAFTPQGPGPALGHKCPGYDYTTSFLSVFMIHLLRGYEWKLPSQRLEFDWSVNPAEPADGLRAVVQRSRG